MFLEIINLVSNILFESELDFSFLLVTFEVALGAMASAFAHER